MSDLEFYKIFENFNSVADDANPYEEVTEADLDEAQTKIEKQGNKVIVTSPTGDRTEFDDEETAAAMMGGEDDMNESEEVTEEDEVTDEVTEDEEVIEEEQLDEVLPALAGVAARAAGTGFGMAAADKMFGEGEPELSTFDAENPTHRKRLQRGTPVVLTPEIFTDPEGDRTGVFVGRSPSGEYCRVVRNCDGREVKCHMSDIVSADIINNSIYETLNSEFDELLEDITVTTTSNPDAPENDTTTVTAIGPDSVDELEAIMQNAGLEKDYEAPQEVLPVAEPTVVDTGEPVAPEAPEELNAGAGCMEELVKEDDLQHLSPEAAKGLMNDTIDMYAALNGLDVSPKDHEILQREYDEISAEYGYHADDDFEKIYDVMYSRLHDMHGGYDGDDASQLGVDRQEYAGPDEEVMDSRDIEHANTPDEEIADLMVLTHGTSGGLNKPKQQFKKEYPGDNPMAVEEDEEEVPTKPGEALDETESFLNLYQEFNMRGEKRS